MNPRPLMCVTAELLFAAIVIPACINAQQDQKRGGEHHKYKLIDLATFGGPASYFPNGFDGILNNHGTGVGGADTSTPDPYPPSCFQPDCFVSHAFQSRRGILTDLDPLAAGWSSQANWVSGAGQIVGFSQNGLIDPLFSFAEIRAVLWEDGRMTDLGTLEGGYESYATAVNNSSQVVGFSLNAIPDPYCLFATGLCTTQTRAFLWQNGVMQDLGTLGGPDASALLVNEQGQVAGQSYTNAAPNPVTGIPTLGPFLWQHGSMIGLGTLGGTLGFPTALNNLGQVVGQSNLAGDQIFHPFLWTKSRGIQDLGTLGGETGTTNWVNDGGEVVGKADLPGPQPQKHDAVLWKNEEMTDLGTLRGDACSNAYFVNSRGQVVGTSEDQTLCMVPTGGRAFLWENGGPMVDLNTLVRPGSSLQLTFAFAINERGEIAGTGRPPGCAPRDIDICGHAYVLIPCAENDDGCWNNAETPAAMTQSHPPALTHSARPATEGPPVPGVRPAQIRARRLAGYLGSGVRPSR